MTEELFGLRERMMVLAHSVGGTPDVAVARAEWYVAFVTGKITVAEADDPKLVAALEDAA